MNRNRLENRVNWSPAENAEITTAVFRAARYRHGLSSTAVPDASQLENVPWGYFQSASVSSMPQPFIPPPPPVAESPSPFEMIRSQNLVIDRFIPPALPVEALPGSSDDSDDCNYRRRNRRKKPKNVVQWGFEGESTDADSKGPEEFRSMSVFPVFEDFQNDLELRVRPNVVKGCYADVNDYLDIQFRLLREDFIYPIREVVKKIVNVGVESATVSCKDVFVYKNVKLLYPPAVSKQGRLVYKVQLDTCLLGYVRWETSKRLIFGSLVCLSRDNFRTISFGTVFDRDITSLSRGQVSICFEGKLFDIEDEINNPNNTYVMVESTGYFEAYRHVLKALQVTDSDDFPMEPYLIKCKCYVRPAAYIERKRTKLSFQCLLKDSTEVIGPTDVLDLNTWPTAAQMDLDESQYAALQTALTCELALIQGPPGTGKTFIGYKIVEFLLANSIAKERRPPILIVCYTNHALDQFLVGIAQFLPTGIVRVGGRCQEEKLERFLLENVMKNHSRTKCFWGRRRELMSEMESEQIRLDGLIEELKMCKEALCTLSLLRRFVTGEQLNYFLRKNRDEMTVVGQWLMESYKEMNPCPVATFGDIPPMTDTSRSHRRLQREESELFDAQMEDLNRRLLDLDVDDLPKPKRKSPLVKSSNYQPVNEAVLKPLLVGDEMSMEEATKVRDVWKLSGANRWRLYRYWLSRHKRQLSKEFSDSQERYLSAADSLQELRNLEKLDILRSAKVVGMTTTGAAIHQGILQQLKPRVVIIEEAAEVLEAHIVTSLTPALEHLLLIGDHKQLRPSPCVYELAVKFNLEISLFERLVMNKFHRAQLLYQHRMRPEICEALMPHFYEELKSHSSVMKRPEIRGVQKNFYFISHSFPEQGESDSNSKRNNFEADYLVHLCKYLLQQDYSAEQITILTPYLGQVSTLRRKIFALSDKELSQVRVTAVDNFQGEENEIILLSLVRSNGMGKIGFLKIPNRCCVALSRAKSGFFCIGDFQHLRTVSPLWEKICASMEAQNAIGPSLSITCGIHGTVKEIGSPELFGHFAPEGGCERSCGAVLACGHTCIKKCHTSDSQHRKYKCEIPVEKEWPDCGHKAIVSCHMSMSHSSCPEICKATLNCGHICTGNCGECRRGRIHIICRQKCHRPLVCGHYCQAECGRPCPPCQLFCENGCAHRSCSQSSVFNGVKQTITGNTCSEPCAYCQADCSTSCLHTRCLKKCHEICDPTAICSANCGKRLPCGHSCAGLCGLPCPSICLICDDPILPKLRWKPDVLMYHSLEDLLKSPLIQLEDCGHFAPVKVFDTFLDVNKYFGPVQRVRCPREGCNVPVRRSSRYKRSVQTVSNVVEQIKMKSAPLASFQLEVIRREVVSGLMNLFHSPNYVLIKDLLTEGDFVLRKAKLLERIAKEKLNLEALTKIRNATKLYEFIVEVHREIVEKSTNHLLNILPLSDLLRNLYWLLEKLIFSHLPKEYDDLNTAFKEFLDMESVSFIEWVKRREDQFNGSMVEPFLCEARRYQLIVRYAHVGLLLAARSDREDLSDEDATLMWQIVNRFCYGTDKCGLEEFERSCAFLKLIGDKYGVHVEFISRLDELYLETTPSFAEANWLYCGECYHVFYKEENPTATACPSCERRKTLKN